MSQAELVSVLCYALESYVPFPISSCRFKQLRLVAELPLCTRTLPASPLHSWPSSAMVAEDWASPAYKLGEDLDPDFRVPTISVV